MLDNLKKMLGTEDTALLQLIVSNVTARLKVLLGGIEPPDEMDYIVFEVSVKRFNRIGSEGMTSHTVEGESTNYADDDFAEYSDDIQAFLDTQKNTTRGKVRFI